MRTRTKLLNVLAALAAAVPLAILPATSPALAIGPNLLPFTVTNNTGRGDPVYLYVLGVNLNTGRLGYVNSGGTFTPWAAGSLPPSPAPDVAIAGPGNGGSTTIQVPRGLSGRVYMSLGEKLKFFLTPDGLVQPAPWATGNPNRDILFDWSEFTYNDAGLWLNSSQVDMFAVPYAVTVTGSSGATKKTGELLNNGRDTVINQIKAQAGWANTVYTRSDGTVLRVLAPGKAADAGLFSTTYLDPYINTAWSAYTGKTLTVVPFTDQPNTRYFGRTSGNVMNFTNSSGQQVASFNKPSTANVWGCDGNLGAPNDLVVGPIARTLCAAMHRTTLGTIDTQPGGGPADFYHGTLTNHYSRIIHANMADGKAYGFAFDDVQAQESLVHDGDPRAAGIILTPFGAGGPTTPPTTNPDLPAGFSRCAGEDGQCSVNGTRVVAYGAGTYTYKTVTGSTACTNAAFDGDPAAGLVKSCYVAPLGGPSGYTQCAAENGTCSFTGNRGVAYGANGAFNHRLIAGGTACTNGVFGDPLSGIAKACYLPPAGGPAGGWAQCAAENGTCSAVSGQPVAYGAYGAFAYVTATGNVACANATFGDPIAGTVKACYTRTGGPGGYATTCAAESGTCAFSGVQTVAFGARGRYVFRTFTGNAACTTAAFGGDPLFGVQKSCYLTP